MRELFQSSDAALRGEACGFFLVIYSSISSIIGYCMIGIEQYRQSPWGRYGISPGIVHDFF
ncbi:hypothetical protein APHWI1_1380 [Anaplasma phagocytophilum str. ApWI1]|uniref:Uncharacterized protein n=1 Tax=Anaplasma phagocytophilum str. ApWI1 TaxID=1359155 RepID=A0A0F3PX62_ANAPH|nr:hypothetical protein APHWEB_0140 [Anaplasma phagocytophilum str. Webster]KJV82783.1 hypothetical protein APHHGE2_0600 [Anaplasma phagocytophilum str. HGE2]KJV84577.1 hypothetical protein APHWI1_1380 [Anaplasma phagocytophilum str. ApWI1]KJV87935.1 hypothetical protein APHNYW_0331 [Anaplasma phagocytophilum str. ApNYW]KJZ99255.1 hypothetical protein APHCR_1329 [Anaplasma phagocytophilum str. CR1007]